MADLGFNIDSKPMKKASSELDKMSGAAGRAEKSTNQLESATKAVKTAITGLIAAIGVREIIQYSDAWQGISNQLRQVTSSTSELAEIQMRLVNVSKDTRSNFEATANLYARLARSTSEMGLSTEDLIGLTTTINQSFATSGATATEAAAAITQLSQGLASGALRGDEFNSVSEQAPGIMRAIAKSLNMTIGELRSFAAEGGITADIVVTALRQASDEIDQNFGKTIATFGQNLEVAQTNLMQFIGTSGGISDVMGNAGDMIVWASERLVEFGNILPGMANQWLAFGGDVSTILGQTTGEFEGAAGDIRRSWDNLTKFLRDAFVNFPSNVRAAIQLATVEFAAFVKKMASYGAAIASYLDPRTWFSDDAKAAIQNQLNASLAAADAARLSSINSILAERAVAVDASSQIIKSRNDLGKAIELNTKQMGAFGAAAKPIGKQSAKDAGEEFVNEWQSVADSVANSLQDAIASGDWKTLGDGIGNALAASISGIVSKSITDELRKGITADSGALSQIGAAFGGAIGGAIAGAAVQIIISEIMDYLSDDFDPTEARQAAQGTGTVLGSINAKSDSIMKATEASASASEQLIGINRDMLRALQAMQQGISRATARVTRGVGDVAMQSPGSMGAAEQLAPLGFALNPFLGMFSGAEKLFETAINTQLDVLSGILTLGIVDFGKLLGGRVKKRDEGIQIIGGYITDLIDETIVNAFQTFRVKKHVFDDYDTKEVSQRIGGQVESQFQLVFESIFDSVESAASALGVSSGSMANFQIGTERLSLEGLDAAAQQAELEAYFGTVFDNLAAHTIPWLEEFQKAGEGLGETLARVATIVQVADEAIAMLGVSFSSDNFNWDGIQEGLASGMNLDDAVAAANAFNEAIAKERLIEFAGGIENFISNMTSFTRNFMTDAQQFELNSDALTRAMGDLPLPETREGFLALMQSQDAASAAGAENIATLLRLQGAADKYYDFLEDAEEKRVQEAEQAARDAERAASDAARESERAAAELLRSLEEAMQGTLASAQRSVDAERQLASARLDTARKTHSATMAEIESQRELIIERQRAAEEAVSSTGDMLKKSFSEEQSLIESASDERIAAFEAEIDRANQAASAHRQYANELQSLTDTLLSASSAMSAQSAGARRSAAQAGLSRAVTAARRGNFAPAQNLDMSGLSETSGIFSSAEEMAVDVAKTQNALQDLARLTGNQATVEERAALASESMVAALEQSIELEKQSAAEQIQVLEDQMNALLGIDTSILNLDDAVLAFTAAQDALNNARFEDLLASLDEQAKSADSALQTAETSYQAQITALDAIMNDARMQVEISQGIDNSVISVRDAMDKLSLAVDDYNAELLARADAQKFDEQLQLSRMAAERQAAMLETLNRMELSQKAADEAIAKHTAATARFLERMERNGIELAENVV